MNKNLLYILIGGGLLFLLTKKKLTDKEFNDNYNKINRDNVGEGYEGSKTYVELVGEAGNRPEGV